MSVKGSLYFRCKVISKDSLGYQYLNTNTEEISYITYKQMHTLTLEGRFVGIPNYNTGSERAVQRIEAFLINLI